MSNKFNDLKIDTHIIFKKNKNNKEECAKIRSIEDDGYGVKQYFNELLVSGFIEYENIIRVPEKEEISKIKGSKSYDLLNKSNRKISVVGFQSNLIDNNNNNKIGKLRGV